MNKRAYALDALRGYSIITMVLSATVAWNSLPGWMYHAQTPPPDRAFDASLSGITWVDLVFPFFLFAMGAAFPFSIKKRFEKGDTKLRLVYEAIKRGVQLTFFAIFIQHFYPYVLSNPQDVRAWLLSILCFIILFLRLFENCFFTVYFSPLALKTAFASVSVLPVTFGTRTRLMPRLM